jgi:hypothetical protein
MAEKRASESDWVGFSACSEDAFSALSSHADDIAVYDSCSVHLTPFRRLLHEYVPRASGYVIQLGGSERTPILGIGTSIVRAVVNGETKLHRITNVRDVKNARSTLI